MRHRIDRSIDGISSARTAQSAGRSSHSKARPSPKPTKHCNAAQPLRRSHPSPVVSRELYRARTRAPDSIGADGRTHAQVRVFAHERLPPRHNGAVAEPAVREVRLDSVPCPTHICDQDSHALIADTASYCGSIGSILHHRKRCAAAAHSRAGFTCACPHTPKTSLLTVVAGAVCGVCSQVLGAGPGVASVARRAGLLAAPSLLRANACGEASHAYSAGPHEALLRAALGRVAGGRDHESVRLHRTDSVSPL